MGSRITDGVGVLGPALCAGVALVSFACGKTTDVLRSNGGGAGSVTVGEPTIAFGGRASAGSPGVGGAKGDSGAWEGQSGAAVNPLDPYAAQRKQIADDFCGLLETYPCLRFFPLEDAADAGGGRADASRLCSQITQATQYSAYGDGCFDEWAADMQCRINQPRACPCSLTDCLLQLPGGTPSACSPEDQSLSACSEAVGSDQGTASGSDGPCTWFKTATGACQPSCDRSKDARRDFAAMCTGSPDGPQVCYCTLNGVPLADGTPNNSLYGSNFYADSCRGVAEAMASGRCKILSCCFTWMPADVPGQPSAEQCSCMSDPRVEGFDTCDAIAAQGHGKVVDICPQYVAPEGSFPAPGPGP